MLVESKVYTEIAIRVSDVGPSTHNYVFALVWIATVLTIWFCRVTLIGKRAVLKTVVAVKGDGSSSLSPCVG